MWLDELKHFYRLLDIYEFCIVLWMGRYNLHQELSELPFSVFLSGCISRFISLYLSCKNVLNHLVVVSLALIKKTI